MRHLRSIAAVVAVTLFAYSPIPASAVDPIIDVSGLRLPAGVTVAGDPFSYYDEMADATLVCLVFSYTGEPSTLFFHDFAVNGQQTIADSFVGRQTVEIPSDTQESQPLCVVAAAGDVSLGKSTLNLTSSLANTVIASRTDLAFPGAYDGLAIKLNSLGFDMTDGYFSWSLAGNGSISYDFYVDIAPQADLSDNPVTINVNSATLTPSKGNAITLTGGDRNRVINSDDELWLGSTNVDPEAGLGTLKITADVARVLPSTLKSSAKLPSGLRLSAAPEQWYFDEDAKTTEASPVTLSNSGSKPLSVSMSSAKLFSVTGAVTTDLRVAPKPLQYVTVPAKGSVDISLFAGAYSGDLRFGHTLTLTATVSLVTPSKFDVTGLKVTKGYTVDPLSFAMVEYDPVTKSTDVSMVMSQPAASSDRALIFTSGTINGKVVKAAVIAGQVGPERAQKTRLFYVPLGSVKGDVRLGQTLKVTGNIVAVTKTKYSNSAELDDEGTLAYVDALIAPESWAYDAVKKSTAITVRFANDDEVPATIGMCNLTVTVGGKKVSPAKTNVTIRAGGVATATLFTVPGDLRYGGTQVKVTGSYTVGGC